MSNEVTKYNDTIDSRDIIARIEELESERESLHDAFTEADAERAELSDKDDQEAGYSNADVKAEDAKSELQAWDGENADELTALSAFMEEMKGYGGDEQWRGDWYPVTLVRESYWEEYAQELAEELDLIKSEAQWPYTCIDWEKAARELQMDYTSAEFDGITYWYR